ncbi:MAG: D,D-heptose 1,7-bisphosphate phosphatase [Planctomycetota bacterium]|nr:MAG: D,D-heptose 1,7-bisphosphate phosphatase [Planctomycetota bacterium]
MRPAAFLDRDGTLNRDTDFVGGPEEVELLPGAAEAVRRLRAAGFVPVVVSNQSGVARGYFDERTVRAVNRRLGELLAAAGAPIELWYWCPHLPEGRDPRYAVACDCRKPAPGLLLRAAREHALDLARSVAIGDRERDIEAARAAGVPVTVLLAPRAPLTTRATHVAPDLAAAADWLLARLRP